MPEAEWERDTIEPFSRELVFRASQRQRCIPDRDAVFQHWERRISQRVFVDSDGLTLGEFCELLREFVAALDQARQVEQPR